MCLYQFGVAIHSSTLYWTLLCNGSKATAWVKQMNTPLIASILSDDLCASGDLLCFCYSTHAFIDDQKRIIVSCKPLWNYAGKIPGVSITPDVYTETHEAALSPIAWAASSPFSFAFVTGPKVLKETGCLLKETNCTLVNHSHLS